MAALLYGPQLRTPAADAITVWAMFDGAASVALQVRLVGGAFATAATQAVDTAKRNTVSLVASGLRAATTYEYRLVLDGTPLTTYTTTTMPYAGRFVLYHLSDNHDEAAAALAYAAVLSHYQANYAPAGIPGCLLQTGDLYTLGVGGGTVEDAFGFAIPNVAAMSPCVATLPLLYMWDDHDFGGNNSARDWTPAYADPDDALVLWDWLWRSYPQPAAPSVGYSVNIAGVPIIILDQRSQRTPQTGPVPSTAGDEPLADSRTALGVPQRNWALSELRATKNKGLVLLTSGSTFRDNVRANAPPTGLPAATPVRDSFGLHWKAERNELVRAAWAGRSSPQLMVISGDDHRNTVWDTELHGLFKRAEAPNPGEGLRFREWKTVSGPSNIVGSSGAIFGQPTDPGTYLDWNGPNFDCFCLWDITSNRSGQQVAARIRYYHISGTQNPPGVMAVPTDSQGRFADWYYENGFFETYHTGGHQEQLYPPDHAAAVDGPLRERWEVDEITGLLHPRSTITRDLDDQLRYLPDADEPAREDFPADTRTERPVEPL